MAQQLMRKSCCSIQSPMLTWVGMLGSKSDEVTQYGDAISGLSTWQKPFLAVSRIEGSPLCLPSWQQVQKGRYLHGMLVHYLRPSTLPLLRCFLKDLSGALLGCSTISTCLDQWSQHSSLAMGQGTCARNDETSTLRSGSGPG